MQYGFLDTSHKRSLFIIHSTFSFWGPFRDLKKYNSVPISDAVMTLILPIKCLDQDVTSSGQL